jgi:hypothetical protein
MYRHLYNKQKSCPKTENDIELTDEIKEHILANRVYKVPAPTVIVQNNNTFIQNNLSVCLFDPIEKLTKYMTHQNINILNFDEDIEQKCFYKTDRIKNDGYLCGLKLEESNFIDIVSDFSKATSSSLEDFNILYDDKSKNIRLYDKGVWETFDELKGITMVVKAVQDAYLEQYEIYLFKKYKDTRLLERQIWSEYLFTYYKFLACFELLPYVLFDEQELKTDGWILNDDKETGTDICEQLHKLYLKAEKCLTKAKINKTRKAILKEMKANTKNNLSYFNKKIIDLFKVDEGFKAIMFSNIDSNKL